MQLCKIELAGEYETFAEGFFYQDNDPPEEVIRKIWEYRTKAAFLVVWAVNEKSNNANRLLLDFLETRPLLKLNNIEDLKSWIHNAKQQC